MLFVSRQQGRVKMEGIKRQDDILVMLTTYAVVVDAVGYIGELAIHPFGGLDR